jgi:hypothetical protein
LSEEKFVTHGFVDYEDLDIDDGGDDNTSSDNEVGGEHDIFFFLTNH